MTTPPTRNETGFIGASRALGRSLSPAWHSRRVAYLKLVLPAVALVIVTTVLVWPQLMPDEKRFRLGSGNAPKMSAEDASATTMLSPKLIGTDEQNRPYVLTAQSATQRNSKSPLVEMAEPKADMTVERGAWIAVTSEQGLYNRDTRLLHLDGKVALFHDSGMEFHTESATVDFKESEATGVVPIEGQGPSGHITANKGFRLFDRGQRIEFLGKSKVILRPGSEAS